MDKLYGLIQRLAYDTPTNLPKIEASDANFTNIFNLALGLAGAVAVAYIVYGGIKFSTSQGDPGKTKEAREAIIYAAIGLVVVMVSFAIVNFVIGKV